jgi:hypothetical protein
VALSVGCAATPDDVTDDESTVDTADALSACGRAKYDAALAHYKNAVAWSRDRLARGVCESDNGLQWGIADEASRAVMTCGDFRTVIRTSPWASPLRTALGNSLTLASLTGELQVIRDSSFQNWSGVDKLFARGVTFWARAEGAYGSAVRIDFREGGRATRGAHTYDPKTGDIGWGTTAATYTISKTTERGLRTVRVTYGKTTDTYVLRVENPWRYNDAPIFVLESSNGAKKLYSLVSECDA